MRQVDTPAGTTSEDSRISPSRAGIMSEGGQQSL